MIKSLGPTKIRYSGLWGHWGGTQYCGGAPYKGHAVSFKLRVEPSQGSGDDTSLNAICLSCSGGDQICSKVGPWGNWYGLSTAPCPGGFGGFKFRFEGSQGSGDDTAANNVHLRCNGSGHWKGTTAPNLWGSWSGPYYCPSGYVICGLRTRVENPIDGDDTALNGVEFTCCKAL